MHILISTVLFIGWINKMDDNRDLIIFWGAVAGFIAIGVIAMVLSDNKSSISPSENCTTVYSKGGVPNEVCRPITDNSVEEDIMDYQRLEDEAERQYKEEAVEWENQQSELEAEKYNY